MPLSLIKVIKNVVRRQSLISSLVESKAPDLRSKSEETERERREIGEQQAAI